MSITFECECGRRLKAGDDKAGRAFRCPACGATVKVPQSEFVAAVLPEEESASDNSHHLDEEDAPVDETSHLIPSIADDVDAQVVALPPRVLPTPPPLGESVKPSVPSQPSGTGFDKQMSQMSLMDRLTFHSVSQPSGTASGTKHATGGITAMQGYIIIAILLIGLGAPLFGVLKPTPKWEYKVENVYGSDSSGDGPANLVFRNKIELFGNEGWELVTARPKRVEHGWIEYDLIFKRRKFLVLY